MPTRRFTDSEEEQIAKIYLAGHSARAIMRAYGLTSKTVILSALRRQGVKQRSPAERNRIYRLNPHVFDVIDNELAAYWLGYIYADGNVYKRSLKVTVKRADRKHLRKLKDFLKTEAPLKDFKAKANGKLYAQTHLYVTDRKLATRLRQLGILPRRPELRAFYSDVPENLLRHLVRGLFDGDGCAYKPEYSHGGALSFCGSRQLMEWLRALLAHECDFSAKRRITKHSKSNLCYLKFAGRRVALRVADWFYQDATVWLERKRDIIDSWPIPQARVRDELGRFT